MKQALSVVSSPLGEVPFKKSPWHKNESDPVKWMACIYYSFHLPSSRSFSELTCACSLVVNRNWLTRTCWKWIIKLTNTERTDDSADALLQRQCKAIKQQLQLLNISWFTPETTRGKRERGFWPVLINLEQHWILRSQEIRDGSVLNSWSVWAAHVLLPVTIATLSTASIICKKAVVELLW